MKDREPWDGHDIQADPKAHIEALADLPHDLVGVVLPHEGDLDELWRDEPLGG